MPGVSSAGASRGQRRRASCSTRWGQVLHERRPVHRSDRGSQYLSIKDTERLAEADVEPSVGSVGDSYDNALATITRWARPSMASTKPRSSIGAGRGAASKPSSSPRWTWVDGFNNRRLLGPIGNIPPTEAEERYYAMLEQSAMVAWFKPNRLRQTWGGSAP